ncbi:MAG TPA: SPFH domain-containing protein [Vicinamibacteria bacterium]|nr:SPFH domain-containing protein [Vicinamibacteria bacterium]
MLGVKLALFGLGGVLALAALGRVLLHALRLARRSPEAGLPASPRRPVTVLGLGAAGSLALGGAIVLVPPGHAGIRVNDLRGTRPGVLRPGVHLVMPLVERVVLYDLRERVLSTADSKRATDPLTAQSREGLRVGLAITVRYRLDVARLESVHANLPEAIESELVAPIATTAFRQVLPQFLVREVFAARREEVRDRAEAVLKPALEARGILVSEVLLRDVTLPPEYAKGLEALLLKEQENERLDFELQIKQKQVRQAELEAEAAKAREVKAAEARAQVLVVQAKAEADAMQHTLPLKEKQVQQRRLEAEAEAEKSRILAEAEANRIRVKAGADAERMRLEAAVLKDNPLLIQKIVAEKLSDKMQIMMLPMDGRYLFNDMFRLGGEVDGSPALSSAKTSARR